MDRLMRARMTLATAVLSGAVLIGTARQGVEWVSRFDVSATELGPNGRNAYFVLEPGHVAAYAAGDERLVITVLDQTKQVDGVETRVVEERETSGGKLVEVSRNYFAIDARTHDVFYFGEAVDIYRNDKIVGHEGGWEAGLDGARFGLMMPAEPRFGAKFYQEVAPKIAMDRAAIVALHKTVVTPAGEFKDCVMVEETTALEPGVREYKYYARDVGLVQDGSLRLVRSR
jgi:hypothetical protein